MREKQNGLVRIVLILFAFALTATTLSAQLSRSYPAADSPYWWPLVDDLGPAELRRLRTSPEEMVRFHYIAAENNLVPKLSQQDTQQLREFLYKELTADFVRLPEAVKVLTLRLESGFRESTIEALRTYELTPTQVKRIVAAVDDLNEEAYKEATRLQDSVAVFWTAMTRAQEEMPREKYSALLRSRNWKELSRHTEVSASELKEAADAWLRDPLAEEAVRTAVRLRGELPGEAWEVFRGFLHREIASEIVLIRFADPTLE